MLLEAIRTPARLTALIAAVALVLPVAPAMARTHAALAPVTVTPLIGGEPLIGSTTHEGSEAAGRLQVAQNNRDARRRNARRNRNQRRHRQSHHRHNRGPVYHNGRRYHYRNGGYYDNTGAALAAGVLGLAAGAVIGGAIADSSRPQVVVDPVPAPYTAEWYRRCDVKYRSFRASDGTFMGYDGVRRTCVLP